MCPWADQFRSHEDAEMTWDRTLWSGFCLANFILTRTHYNAYKTCWVSNIESNSILIKEGCYPFVACTSMDPDFAGDSTDCFVGGVRRSSTCYFRFFPVSIVLQHRWLQQLISVLFAKRKRFLCVSPGVIFFVDCNTWLYSCFVLAYDRTSQNVQLLWKCCRHCRLCHKTANSILGW